MNFRWGVRSINTRPSLDLAQLVYRCINVKVNAAEMCPASEYDYVSKLPTAYTIGEAS